MYGDFDSPVIELHVRALGKQFQGVLATYSADVEAELKRGIEKAVAEFDFESHIRAAATKALRESVDKAIKNYFAFGEGHKEIEKLVSRFLEGVSNER